jgi:hypothetical protein
MFGPDASPTTKKMLINLFGACGLLMTLEGINLGIYYGGKNETLFLSTRIMMTNLRCLFKFKW